MSSQNSVLVSDLTKKIYFKIVNPNISIYEKIKKNLQTTELYTKHPLDIVAGKRYMKIYSLEWDLETDEIVTSIVKEPHGLMHSHTIIEIDAIHPNNSKKIIKLKYDSRQKVNMFVQRNNNSSFPTSSERRNMLQAFLNKCYNVLTTCCKDVLMMSIICLQYVRIYVQNSYRIRN